VSRNECQFLIQKLMQKMGAGIILLAVVLNIFLNIAAFLLEIEHLVIVLQCGRLRCHGLCLLKK